MASIFTSPLSLAARKALCGLTRLKTMIPSASCARRSMRTDMPLSRRPTSTVSMLERIGQPALLSVTPSPASSAFWPSAVAPPWLPMAGTTKGSAPQARTRAAMAATRTGSSAMPRLPTLRATRMPGRTALARPGTPPRLGPKWRVCRPGTRRERTACNGKRGAAPPGPTGRAAFFSSRAPSSI